jgi:hypothetical protein
VAWHLENRIEHAGVADVAPLELLVDHPESLALELRGGALKPDVALHASGEDKNRTRR